MLFDDEEEGRYRAHYWIERWASRQRANRQEILADVGYPPATVLGALSKTNYAVSEDDREAYYERHEAAQVEIVDVVMMDLLEEVPWAAWAISRRHRLGSLGLDRYEYLIRNGQPPPGLYSAALDELIPLLAVKGLV